MVLPPENASQDAVNQSAGRATLRLGGLDLFPHAAGTVLYDDNILIAHTNALSDVKWTFSPGLTIAAGDVSTAFPGSVTLSQLRGLLNYSPVEDSAKPQRFLGLDYTPSFNIYTGHDRYDNVDSVAGLSAGYNFSRLVLGLDEDFSRLAVKDNNVGNLITESVYETRLHSRYELTDRSALEVNTRYCRLDYQNPVYQGYQEVRNEDWFSRLVGARLEAGAGAAFGFVYPEFSPAQTYQEVLLRGIYRLTGKIDLRTFVGIQFREYSSGSGDTLTPVFSLAAVYLPRPSTTVTLEGHDRVEPSCTGTYNYTLMGFNAGVSQQLSGHLFAGLDFGYNSVVYTLLGASPSHSRSDGCLSARLGLDYEFNTRSTAGVFYTRQQNISTLQNYTYYDNLIGIQLSWRL